LKNDYGDVNEPEVGQEWEQWREQEEHFFHSIINFLIS